MEQLLYLLSAQTDRPARKLAVIASHLLASKAGTFSLFAPIETIKKTEPFRVVVPARQ